MMMTIGNKPVTIYFEDWSNLNVETFSELLNMKLNNYGVKCNIDNCNCYYFECNELFWFNDVSYNVKLLLGLYSKKDDEIKAEKLKA